MLVAAVGLAARHTRRALLRFTALLGETLALFFSLLHSCSYLTCPNYCKQTTTLHKHLPSFSSLSSSNPNPSKTANNRLPGSAFVDQRVSRVTGNLAAGVECRQPSEAGKAWLPTWDFPVGLERDKRALKNSHNPYSTAPTACPCAHTCSDIRRPAIHRPSSLKISSPRKSLTPTPARAASATSTLSIHQDRVQRRQTTRDSVGQQTSVPSILRNPQSDSRCPEICSLPRARSPPPTQPRRRRGRLGRFGTWSSC